MRKNRENRRKEREERARELLKDMGYVLEQTSDEVAAGKHELLPPVAGIIAVMRTPFDLCTIKLS